MCRENKEQRGKRKFHEGDPHPNDRGGFTQWFGSCSLINTLYVWFPASWANGYRAVVWFVVQSGEVFLSSTWGLSQHRSGCILGTYLGARLLALVDQWLTWIAPRWCTKPAIVIARCSSGAGAECEQQSVLVRVG